jgi:hypothetical protein
MNVTLSLKPEVEEGLLARAHDLGLSLDDYLQEIIAKEAGLPVAAEPPAIKNRSIISPTYSSIPPLPEPILIWSGPKTVRARLIWRERLPDRYECSVRVQPAGRPRCWRQALA